MMDGENTKKSDDPQTSFGDNQLQNLSQEPDSETSGESRDGTESVGSGAPPSQQNFYGIQFAIPTTGCRRKYPEATCPSGGDPSIDLRDLPFAMPKLRRLSQLQPSNLEPSASEASANRSEVEPSRQAPCRSKLFLNFEETRMHQHLAFPASYPGFGPNFNPPKRTPIDITLPFEKQGWYHGSMSREEAENILKTLREGSFLVRDTEFVENTFSLSLKSVSGLVHMIIRKNTKDGCFIIGRFGRSFRSIAEMIQYFTVTPLEIKYDEYMCLTCPVMHNLYD